MPEANFANLSVEDKAAQLIMIDIPDQELKGDSARHLQEHTWNGVILFAKNVQNRLQVNKLIEDIHKNSKLTPFIAVDQEGGLVDRFRYPEMSLSPGAMALGTTNSEEAVYEAHRIMAEELRDLGIHIDFAPCLDVNNNSRNPIIGVRSFSADPQRVAAFGCAAIRGLRDGGVIPTAKHFPGHGNTDTDSHLALPSIKGSRTQLEETELVPFKAAIREQVEAIMTAHIVFPALDRELPATLSKTILTDLLRHELGYEGVIVTDSLAMKSIANTWGFGEAAVMSIEAGADLILALGTFEQQLESLQAIVDAVKQGRISQKRLDESLARLEKLRVNHQQLPSTNLSHTDEHRAKMAEIVAQTAVVLRDRRQVLPLKLSQETKIAVVSPDLLPQSPLGEVSQSMNLAPMLAEYGLQAQEFKFNMASFGPPLNQLVRDLEGFDCVILALYARGQLSDSQKELAREIPKVCPQTILLPLSSPYFLDNMDWIDTAVTSFNYSPASLRAALAKILS
ncbi:MAG: beta-N-acetylhexosaminidase [Candidatus Bruticola sp.]